MPAAIRLLLIAAVLVLSACDSLGRAVIPETGPLVTAAVAATDFVALKSHPFTGVCPLAFDRQELIFEFSIGAVTQRVASCEVDVDWGHPLFVALGVALGQWIPLPLT